MIKIGNADGTGLMRQAVIALVSGTGQLFRALTKSRLIEAMPVANNNVTFEGPPRSMPSDPMSLREIKVELRLTEKQIVTLRRLWGFPVPFDAEDHSVFSRSDVDLWAKRQPNPDNLAAVLRLRRRDKWRIDRYPHQSSGWFLARPGGRARVPRSQRSLEERGLRRDGLQAGGHGARRSRPAAAGLSWQELDYGDPSRAREDTLLRS